MKRHVRGTGYDAAVEFIGAVQDVLTGRITVNQQWMSIVNVSIHNRLKMSVGLREDRQLSQGQVGYDVGPRRIPPELPRQK